MAKYDFSKVRALIGEQSPILRKGIRHALFTLGFREIVDSSSFVDVHSHLDRDTFDLLVLNSEMDGNDTTYLVREIRRGKMHKDPFVVVLLVVTRADEPHIKLAINSGADDILLVPFSPDQLMQRMANVHERRKPFIVTHDYIGPDRRRNQRQGASSASTINVPNPYLSRSAGIPDARYAVQLTGAQAEIARSRVVSLAKAIEWELRTVCAMARENGIPDDLVSRMYRLEEFGEELIERLRGKASIDPIETFRERCRAVKNAPAKVSITMLGELHDAAKTISAAYLV